MVASARRRARGVERLLRRVAQRTGDGKTLTGNIRRLVGRSGPVFNPVQVFHTYTITALWGAFESSERAGGLVSDGDARLFMASVANKDPVPVGADQAIIDAPATIAPAVGDTVTVDSVAYLIETLDATRPGGAVVLWRAKVTN